MSEPNALSDPFLRRVTAAIESHLQEEEFGVAELAEEMNMSRSTLLRKVKSATGLSAALFIRQVRLEQAKVLLHDPTLTISEVAYQVGFSSSSYFAKCFREEYGYPPGEETKQEPAEPQPAERAGTKPVASPNWRLVSLIGAAVLFTGIGLILWWPIGAKAPTNPKTIAVLPFQNDSDDSTNVYLINGLMAALIDNLHQVRALQVTSRTTVERYRGLSRTVPELAEELGVKYFVEGSGQKIGDQILLTLRLVDGEADTLIWSRQFERETTDIFQLQTEVATSIARGVEASISPEEEQRIQLPPTENLVAYDLYLKGLEQIRTESREGLAAGIDFFQQAIDEDPEFAHPHAYLAISYYFLDLFQAEKSHVDDINTHADRALLLDPSLNESLIGKALYYMEAGEYELATRYFQQVLAKSPNSGWIHNLMSTIYLLHLPNTEEYLHHALQGIRYTVAGQDSVSTSFAYLHLSNALAQNGFLPEADPYVQQSLRYFPDNLYAGNLAIYIQLGQVFDLDLAYQRFQALLAKDSTFLATLQEVAKMAYLRGDYEAARGYYQRFDAVRQAASLDLYPGADINMAFVWRELGLTEEAKRYSDRYAAYLEQDESIYRDLGLATYEAWRGNKQQAMTYLKAFAKQKDLTYWMIMLLDKDPILQTLADQPTFQPTIGRIQENFHEQHRHLREELETEGVLDRK